MKCTDADHRTRSESARLQIMQQPPLIVWLRTHRWSDARLTGPNKLARVGSKSLSVGPVVTTTHLATHSGTSCEKGRKTRTITLFQQISKTDQPGMWLLRLCCFHSTTSVP